MVDADARCVKCVVGGVRILTDGGRSLRAIVRMTDRGLRIGRRAYDSRAEHCACGEGSEEEGAHGDYSRLGSIRRCDGRVVPVSGLEGQRRLWSATARGVPARRTGNRVRIASAVERTKRVVSPVRIVMRGSVLTVTGRGIRIG